MKTSEFLRNAREHVNRGWCKRKGRDEYGNVCVMGAICRAEAEMGAFNTGYAVLRDQLKEFGYPPNLVLFNDAPETTKQDVLNLFDKAILSLEERGL